VNTCGTCGHVETSYILRVYRLQHFPEKHFIFRLFLGSITQHGHEVGSLHQVFLAPHCSHVLSSVVVIKWAVFTRSSLSPLQSCPQLCGVHEVGSLHQVFLAPHCSYVLSPVVVMKWASSPGLPCPPLQSCPQPFFKKVGYLYQVFLAPHCSHVLSPVVVMKWASSPGLPCPHPAMVPVLSFWRRCWQISAS
jgi:hypothetical protein